MYIKHIDIFTQGPWVFVSLKEKLLFLEHIWSVSVDQNYDPAMDINVEIRLENCSRVKGSPSLNISVYSTTANKPQGWKMTDT